MFSLGSQLVIGSDVYEDLDEIIARHIAPMADFVRALTHQVWVVSGLIQC
jgi:transcription elongation factor SPT6